ncbi:MAG: DUF3887 domain-containing protein [Planctomycetota bacterium]|jgi:uncharacterized protein YukE
MPAVKRIQSSAWAVPAIVFVGLFLVAATLAFLFYYKFEKQKTMANEARRDLAEMANRAQLRDVARIVGAKKPRQTYLGTMVDYLDQTASTILGAPLQETSAEVKIENVNKKFAETLALLAQQEFHAKNAAPKTPDNEFVELLAGGQFANAVESMDENMKKVLPPQKLEQAWKATLTQMGDFKKQIGARTEKQMGFDIVFVTCEFANGPLDVKLSYDNNNRVAGLYFTPTPPDALKGYQPAPDKPARETPHIGTIDPNTTGLIRIVEMLKGTLDHTTDSVHALSEQLEQLHNRFDDFKALTYQKEQTLLAEKEKYRRQVDKIKQDYDELEELVKKTSDERTRTLMAELDDLRSERDKMEADLLETDAKLATAQERIAHLQSRAQAIMPPPDSNVPAYLPDGQIMFVNGNIVHLNIGSDDRVYRGLTFSVYNKGMPIPKDGRGKAEIEVFDVGKNVSAARVTRSEKRRPIVAEDIIANLIWDSHRTNMFAVVGDFDLNGDGQIEYDAVDRISIIIEKWGGTVTEDVSVDTDFLILGRPPRLLPKPTMEQITVDPMATEKYEASVDRLNHYDELLSRSQALRIPVFNTDRFLHFIGYKALAARSDAF